MSPACIFEDDFCFATGERPWHGLGEVVETELTAEEAIKAAKLDWEVELCPVEYKYFTEHPFGGPLIEMNGTDRTHNVVVRPSTGTALGIVGNVYTPLQNKDAFGFFDEVVGAGQAIYHTAGSLFNGRKVWILAKLPEPILVAGKDPVEPFLLLTHSHDGKSKVRMLWTPVRVVCNNTLQAALCGMDSEGVAIRHTSNIHNRLEEAQEVLGLAKQGFETFNQVADAMVATPFVNPHVDVILNRILGINEDPDSASTQRLNIKNKILELVEDGTGIAPYRGTVWGFMNAITEYADHERTMRVRRVGNVSLEQRKAEQHMDSVFFGSVATFKKDALAEVKRYLLVAPPVNSDPSTVSFLTGQI
jgi:phage/plasmid-like protein (TIGR03299 family)